MFRKRTKNPNKNLRRKRTDESESKQDGDDHDDDEATGIAIRNTMKKQKILASLPLASGSVVPKENAKIPMPEQSTAELSVLAKKHARNMEAYIEEKMAASEMGLESKKYRKDEDSKQVITRTTNEITSEEDLYRQLAQEVTANVGNSNDDKNLTEAGQSNDGDQGDGGAALLVGTGIAEVILPSTAHKPVVAMTTSRVYNRNNNMLSSAVPEGERHKHVLSSTTPKPFVKFRSSQNTIANENKREETTNEETPTIDKNTTERQGFDAFRGKAPAPDSNDGERDKQKGNRWKTGKDRDDQVYSQFLKNALSGKRR